MNGDVVCTRLPRLYGAILNPDNEALDCCMTSSKLILRVLLNASQPTVACIAFCSAPRGKGLNPDF
ncbi:hypothetical protein CCR75_008208 [Bremia lactucae]|uniref:Uncharacterized protein n=1 Tax=Bremia lactucae TaxID=4779 RepID=A0A976IG62_BRELC|nr:hypothetical protein CCR75_008208 [Bremia lactucae]